MSDTPPPTLALGPGGEFDVVRRFIERWGASAVGIGGDSAVLAPPPGSRLLVSTDASVEDVHFRREWLTPREIGWRATVAALSDLAAVAAMPLGLLLALVVPPAWRAVLDELADGVGAAARATATPIVGGDISAGAQLVLAITVLGHAPSPLSRHGARVGDALYVTGPLGGPRAALDAWMADEEPAAAHRARFAAPMPRLAEARWLREHGATAAIDLSDGLAADAAHLAAASGVRLWLDLDEVPCIAGVDPRRAVASGEEYELLVAAPAELDLAAYRAEHDRPLFRVGMVQASGPIGVAARVDLPGGHDHLSP